MDSKTKNQSWLIDLAEQKLDGEFNQPYANLIVKVAANSPASEIGLEAGDSLVSVDGAQASTTELMQKLVQPQDSIRYQFYSHGRHVYLNVVASKIPLGIVTEPGSAAIVEQYREDFPGYDGLRTLWDRQNWEMLREASEELSLNHWVFRLIKIFKKDFGKSAETLFLGAAKFELGDPAAGMELISWFIDNELQLLSLIHI